MITRNKTNKWLCYFHKKPNEEIFYVGIGNSKRPYSKDKRSKFWHNIVNKYGYTVEIVREKLSWRGVCKLEKMYIKQIGRRDLKLGPLVNQTDGGDGTINASKESRERSAAKQRGRTPWNKNIPMSEEAKIKSHKSHLGNKQTKETREKISKNHRRFQSKETRKKLSDAIKKSWQVERKYKQGVLIFGIKYKSMYKATKMTGINYREMCKLCSDSNNNNYTYIKY